MSTIDQQARDLAEGAKSQIDGHEKLCSERWNQARTSMDRVATELSKLSDRLERKIDTLYGRLWWMVGGVIGSLIAIVGFLAVRATE